MSLSREFSCMDCGACFAVAGQMIWDGPYDAWWEPKFLVECPECGDKDCIDVSPQAQRHTGERFYTP